MASIAKVSKGKFRVFILTTKKADGTWARHSETVIGSRDDAVRRGQELDREREQLRKQPDLNKLTLADWWERYQKFADLEENTLRGYRSFWQRIDITLGYMPIRLIRRKHVLEFIDQLHESKRLDGKEGKLSPTSIRRHYALLHLLLAQAVYQDIIPVNPADQIEPPRENYVEPRVINQTQLDKLVNHIWTSEPLHIQVAALLTLQTGMRRGELIGLKWSDIDWKNSQACLERVAIASKDGQKCKPYTKNKKHRPVPLCAEVIGLLKRWREEAGQHPDGYIFVWPGSNEWFSVDNPTHILPIVTQRAGIGHFTPHSLRHTSISNYLRAGLNIAEVAALAGHSSPQTTARKYSHVISDVQKRATKIGNNMVKKRPVARDIARGEQQPPEKS